jgi:hypothetical protein
MGCWFSPSDCTNGEPTAANIKLIFILIGSVLAALLIPFSYKGRKLWTNRALAFIAIAVGFYFLSFMADFWREFSF